jgi:DNA invertase Pin-like site-specific DNA recombinase
MTLVGYARVSSVGQSLDVQLEKLKHCKKIFQEKKSGTSDERSQLVACLEYVREDDTLVVTRLDRFARSTLHLCQIADELSSRANLTRLFQSQNTNNHCVSLLEMSN